MRRSLRALNSAISARVPSFSRRALCSSASTSTPPPAKIAEAESLSEAEFRRSVAGGASAYAVGEMGAPPSVMRAFWNERGVGDDMLHDDLALKAKTRGGVWGDPPTLAKRLDALEKLLPMQPEQLSSLLSGTACDVLLLRSDTLRTKVHALSSLLPKTDVLRLFMRMPILLRHSPEWYKRQVSAARALLPRADMDELIAEKPRLLMTPHHELLARTAAFRSSYVPEAMARWSPQKALAMLHMPSKRLERLKILEGLNPGLRVALPDRKVLQMDEKKWMNNFVLRKRSRWRGGRAVRPEPWPRELSPLARELPPDDVNALAWGREKARAIDEAYSGSSGDR